MIRHRFHSICPYFAMFPETFVAKYLPLIAQGEVVFDPFAGRGTTVFESLLWDRRAAGCDTNPVAFCISNAKSQPPLLRSVLARIDQLQEDCAVARGRRPLLGDFFKKCFHPDTLSQIQFLREKLNWRTSRVDGFVAALVLGTLHGESHRSKWVLSNRMPRTISTKPTYSVKWWRSHRCVAPHRDTFSILREVAQFRYASGAPRTHGRVALCDARRASAAFPSLTGKVRLIVTSPPYLDTTNYAEDQWLRLWFLGGPAAPDPSLGADDRHRNLERYLDFLSEAWAGVSPLTSRECHLVIRLGGAPGDVCSFAVAESLSRVFGRRAKLLWSGTDELPDAGQGRSFMPSTRRRHVEHDFHFLLR